ncbi:MAG: F0F1 ATP synthase subunit A [Odoribacter sp.]
MMGYIKYIVLLGAFLLLGVGVWGEEAKEPFNPQELIFEHLGDEYGWNIAKWTIPLPVMVWDEAGGFHCFSSARLGGGAVYEGFYMAEEGEYAGKVVAKDAGGSVYRPWDVSITKNALALMICGLVLCGLVFPLVRWYKKHPNGAPRRMKGMLEVVVEMLYKDVICSMLGKDARRYAPYLLTVFFFILVANLLGLIVVFPGGANLMGNLSVTMVLALCTFVVVNVGGKKAYWKDIFWSDVPTWLKCPIPMMPVIELFGIFTKPIALMIRLFANMLGGHLITLVLISLIFMFSAMGAAVTGATTVVSVVFAIFMELIDILICFIQAYVFMMLSTIFISLSRSEEATEEKAVKTEQ